MERESQIRAMLSKVNIFNNSIKTIILFYIFYMNFEQT